MAVWGGIPLGKTWGPAQISWVRKILIGPVKNNKDPFKLGFEGQPERRVFSKEKGLIREGPARVRLPVLPEWNAATVSNALSRGDIVVDTRLTPDFVRRHAKETLNVPRNKSFLNWAGSLVPYDRQVIFIGDASDEARKTLMSDLSLIVSRTLQGCSTRARWIH